MLRRAFLIGGFAAGAAVVMAAVMLVWWRKGRSHGQPIVAAAVAFFACVAVAGASAGWLAYQRHEKCGRTVARTLCRPPVDWLH
jgi:hypothetical protein